MQKTEQESKDQKEQLTDTLHNSRRKSIERRKACRRRKNDGATATVEDKSTLKKPKRKIRSENKGRADGGKLTMEKRLWKLIYGRRRRVENSKEDFKQVKEKPGFYLRWGVVACRRCDVLQRDGLFIWEGK